MPTVDGVRKLKKELGLFELCAYGVGLILGAGIYTIIGEAAGLTGGSLPLAFLTAALIAILTGLSFAELSSMYPKAEGAFLYVKKAFENKFLSDATAFFRVFVGVVSTAAVAIAFSGYLTSFVNLPMTMVALGIIALMSIINFWGIEFSAKINVIFTAIETLGLLIIIAMGLGSFESANILHFARGFNGFFASSFLLFFSYIGFSSIVNLSEESKDATEKVPKAIMISILFTTVIYFLVALSATSLVNWQLLGQSASPLALVASQAWGQTAFTVIGLIAIFSTTNTMLIDMISTSRILYGVSKKKYQTFPAFFSRVHRTRRTPHVAIAAVGILTAAFALLGDIGLVAGIANLLLFILFVLVNAALLKLRYKYPDEKRGFKAPFNIGKFSVTAFLGIVFCVIFILLYLNQVL